MELFNLIVAHALVALVVMIFLIAIIATLVGMWFVINDWDPGQKPEGVDDD